MTGKTVAPGKSLRLFCLPYAGGSARLFQDWRYALPDFVEVCPVELPGRGTRFGELPYTRLEPLVDDVLDTLEEHLDEEGPGLPFALFGYSFGSAVAFEAARRLEAAGRRPACLAVAAFRSPGASPPRVKASSLPDAEFRRLLRELGGTPRELLENDAFMELMLPVIKADFSIAESYGHRSGPPLDCPIVAFGGEEDPLIGMAEVRTWSRHTAAGFSLRPIPGDHFFMHSHRELLLKELATELATHR
ncbi:thioesterase II family protein [Streptomyces gobiensis]|uniref:thioesterase II family protein n=1 Tax=Streptomyces gobiensis TaxID=2875706 RepID=UPI001E5BB322|nr:alpha/beta fold hydrolase [Streptomyces gobiensis]UGY93641.1 alpha/beta fold hydrolase [Streptomyces gobiensis]